MGAIYKDRFVAYLIRGWRCMIVSYVIYNISGLSFFDRRISSMEYTLAWYLLPVVSGVN